MTKLRQYYYDLLTFLSYIKRWGSKGVSIYFSVRKSSPAVIELSVPGYKNPVYIRSGTSDLYSFEHIYAHECYKFPGIDRTNVRVILDCGANAGHAALYFSEIYPDAKIIAVEPDTQNLALIRRNAGANPNIEAIHSAVWGYPCHLKIMNGSASNWAFRVTECSPEDAGAFPATSIGDIVRTYGISRIDILKIDIEGSEIELFKDNFHDWLSITRNLVIELHDRIHPGCTEQFMQAISGYSHTMRRSGENLIVQFD